MQECEDLSEGRSTLIIAAQRLIRWAGVCCAVRPCRTCGPDIDDVQQRLQNLVNVLPDVQQEQRFLSSGIVERPTGYSCCMCGIAYRN